MYILVFVATNSIAILDDFDDINSNIYGKVLVPLLTDLLYNDCKKQYNFIARFIVSQLINQLNDDTIILPSVKELFKEIKLNKCNKDNFSIILSIIQKIVPRLELNELDYDLTKLHSSLIGSNNGPFRNYHVKAKEIEETLLNLKDN